MDWLQIQTGTNIKDYITINTSMYHLNVRSWANFLLSATLLLPGA